MSARKELGPIVKVGVARVYRKNLQKILVNLSQTNLFIQKSKFQNYLIQAEDCLSKLKKVEAVAYTFELENEYNYYMELFLKVYERP